MARTRKYNIYYQDDYTQDADVLADNQAMAESIETALETVENKADNNTIEISNIKNGTSIDSFEDVEVELNKKQNNINSENKLSSDLVDDTNHTNKFVTASEKSQITTNATDISNIKDGTSIDSFGDVETALSGKEDSSNKVTSIDENSTNTQYPSAKVVYDELVERDEEINQLYNDHPDITDTGTDLTLNGTGDLKMKVDVGGNSTQVQYSGKNKLSNLAAVYNTTVNNGVVTQSQADTRTDLIWKCLAYNGNTLVQQLFLDTKNTTGLFSRNFTKDSSFNKIRFGLSGSETDSMVVTEIDNLPDGEYTLSFDVTNTTQGSISWKDIMITSSSETDLSYEPYVGGTASPNPTYKQDINNVEGDVVVKAESRNVFKPTLVNNETNIKNANCTISLDKDEFTLIATGTDMYFGDVKSAGANYNNNLGIKIDVTNKSKIYILLTNTAFNNQYVNAFDNNNVSLGFTNISSNQGTYNIPTNANYIVLRIGKSNAVSGTIYKTKVMVSYDEIDEYIEYKEPNSVTFPLSQGQKLMLGDTLEDDGIHHKRGQVVFDGSNDENWNINNSGAYLTNPYFIISVSNIIADYRNMLCSHLVKGNITSTSKGLIQNYLTNLMCQPSNGVLTIPEWRAWLAENPITVEYELETETIETYTSAQQTAYNKLKEMQSYYDLTYVTGSSDNAQPIITAHAKKSLKVINDEISNINSRLTLLEE